jgi:hypothetical protein
MVASQRSVPEPAVASWGLENACDDVGVLRSLTGDVNELWKGDPDSAIFDEAKAQEFYVDFLGFRVDW